MIKLHKYWRIFLTQYLRIAILRANYRRGLKRIRAKYGKKKIKVVFLLSNPSKWKVQSLYDAMMASDKYEPIVAITAMDTEMRLNEEELNAHIATVKQFLEKRGCSYVMAYSNAGQNFSPMKAFDADLVWYTQPWDIVENQDVAETSKHALTCYTPYFVQNYGYLPMDCGQTLHRLVWRHFTLNKYWAHEFMKYIGFWKAGKVLGLGHPMLDSFNKRNGDIEKCGTKTVIYAPHFSCNTGECYSTFLHNGEKILNLAKSHPEIKWIFKPHPSLYQTLIRKCGWEEQKARGYYDEWRAFAKVCMDGEYVKLFQDSSCLITDCGSFLVEYACTKHPIIHLISSNVKINPHPVSAKLFATYYQAHNWDEFIGHFDKVVLKGHDSQKAERLKVVTEMNLLDVNAAKNIVEYLDKEFA